MTGEIKWKGRGPGKGSAVVIGGGDKLYIQFQDGELALVKADLRRSRTLSAIHRAETNTPPLALAEAPSSRK